MTPPGFSAWSGSSKAGDCGPPTACRLWIYSSIVMKSQNSSSAWSLTGETAARYECLCHPPSKPVENLT